MRRAAQFAFAWLLTALFAASPAAAQCAMCAKSVVAGGTRAIEVIKVGIFVLLIPTILIFGAIALMVYRRRKYHVPEPAAEMPANSLPEFPSSAH